MTNFNNPQGRGRSGKSAVTSQILFGLIIVAVGIGLLLRKAGFPLPYWLFKWEMILIVVGIIGGIRNQFRDIGWIIPIIIGCVFLSDDLFPDISLRGYIWPIALITLGLVIAVNARNRKRVISDIQADFQTSKQAGTSGLPGVSSATDPNTGDSISIDSDVVNITSVFAGTKRTIVSKNFLGGEIVSVFGGSEVNLANADIQGPVTLECTNIFGGTKLIVPSDWDVQSEATAILGGVEDKRHINPGVINPRKKLILIGTSLLGGLEVRNF